MDELFGTPVSYIASGLALAFAIMVAVLLFILIRDNVLVRMALRNVVRRPMRGLLVVVGLMLATAIISSAFTTGDSMTQSIKVNATQSLRALDETIRLDEDSSLWEDTALPEHFSEEVYHEVAPQLEAATDIIDGRGPSAVATHCGHQHKLATVRGGSPAYRLGSGQRRWVREPDQYPRQRRGLVIPSPWTRCTSTATGLMP